MFWNSFSFSFFSVFLCLLFVSSSSSFSLTLSLCHFNHIIYMHMFASFPDSSVGKESTCDAGDLGSIPGLGRYPGEEKGYPLQYSSLENSIDYTVHGVTKSRTRLSYFHFTPAGIIHKYIDVDVTI